MRLTRSALVAVALKGAVEQMGPTGAARTLLKLNQADRFDCQGCAWPDPAPSHRHSAEFCENGAKSVTDYWLGQQGWITEPMVLRAAATHHTPIGWEDALALVAARLNALDSPDQAIFYTPGKTSNEAAFVYQLFARAYGTNNLPDNPLVPLDATAVGSGTPVSKAVVVRLVRR